MEGKRLHTHSLTYSPHTHTHTTQKHTHTLTQTHTHSHTHIHPHTHSLTHSLTHSHTHTHTHTQHSDLINFPFFPFKQGNSPIFLTGVILSCLKEVWSHEQSMFSHRILVLHFPHFLLLYFILLFIINFSSFLFCNC